MKQISTIVITHNEEANIRRCLDSVQPFSSEIVVVDSHSSDRTRDIAREYTPHVLAHDWEGYGPQKQLALSKSHHDWTFSIDADEEVPAALQSEISRLDFKHDGYFVARRVHYLGRWLRHCWYPGYVLRLFRKERACFNNRILHESVEIQGTTTRLLQPLLHYSYRDVAHHLEKMNEFTTLAARQMHGAGRQARIDHLVVTPFLEFLKMYLVRRGFLDGVPGLVVSGLHASYVLQKYAKLFELQQAHGKNANGAT